MQLTPRQLSKIVVQLDQLSQFIQTGSPELAEIAAVGLLNNCSLVRSDWKESGLTRLKAGKMPVLYMSHFSERTKGLSPVVPRHCTRH